MKLIDAYAKILKLNLPVLRTDDVSRCLDITNVHSSKILRRLMDAGHILRISKGLWAIKDKATLWNIVGYLTSPFPYYISLQSALNRYGIISQVPNILYVVSLARTRLFRTPLGDVSIHHIKPSFFCGYKRYNDGFYIATQEKALIDFLYFYPARSHLFRSLPEIEIPANFKVSRAKKFITMIKPKRRQSTVMRLFNNILFEQNRTS